MQLLYAHAVTHTPLFITWYQISFARRSFDVGSSQKQGPTFQLNRKHKHTLQYQAHALHELKLLTS